MTHLRAGVSVLLLLYFFTVANVKTQTISCPEGCFCTETRNAKTIPGDGLGLKINCHPTIDTEKGKFNVQLPPNTVQLDLAKYELRVIESSTFRGLAALQKLDLQNNYITTIEDGAFVHLSKLEVLDLSMNSLKTVGSRTFAGLESLVKLKLTDNNVRTVEAGAFEGLPRLSKLDLSSNQLICDCHLSPFLKFIQDRPNVLANSAKTTCALPMDLVDAQVKKLDPSSLKCDSGGGGFLGQGQPLDNFQSTLKITPQDDQIVLEGDPLVLQCSSSEISDENEIEWYIDLVRISHSSSDVISIEETTLPDFKISTLKFRRMETAFKGSLSCSDKTARSPFVLVEVLAKDAPVCQPISLVTSRGNYVWGGAIGDVVLTQDCEQNMPQGGGDRRRGWTRDPPQASLQCRSTGEWSASVNVSSCAHVSHVTSTLYKFASMNTSHFHSAISALSQSARQLLNFTRGPQQFQNSMDLVYFTQAIENYLPYLSKSKEVGHYLVDMVSNVIGTDQDLLAEAQIDSLVCKRLLAIVANVSGVLPMFRHPSQKLPVETYDTSMSNFNGLTCTWYNSVTTDKYRHQPQNRVFHCSQNNRTSLSSDKIILASIVLPRSLQTQLVQQISTSSSSSQFGLKFMFTAFSNASLFPSTIESPDFESVDSVIIGGQALSTSAPQLIANLEEDPIYVMIRTKHPDVAEPVVWDPYMNGGFGSWSPSHCKVVSRSDDLIWFRTTRLGFYGLRVPRSDGDPIKQFRYIISVLPNFTEKIINCLYFFQGISVAPSSDLRRELHSHDISDHYNDDLHGQLQHYRIVGRSQACLAEQLVNLLRPDLLLHFWSLSDQLGRTLSSRRHGNALLNHVQPFLDPGRHRRDQPGDQTKTSP